MSNKKRAKRIRKKIGYHPKDRRKYAVVNTSVIILVKCTRVRYQAMKRWGSHEALSS